MTQPLKAKKDTSVSQPKSKARAREPAPVEEPVDEDVAMSSSPEEDENEGEEEIDPDEELDEEEDGAASQKWVPCPFLSQIFTNYFSPVPRQYFHAHRMLIYQTAGKMGTRTQLLLFPPNIDSPT